MPGLALYICFISIFLVVLLQRRISTCRLDLNYPPGPPGRSLIGNLQDIPDKKPGGVCRMSKEVISCIANDLLDKRSRIYSGRSYEYVAEMSG
ncbi:cytochrome p450 [Moniliophthora roreri]|nr:cytochrome p450 [Moniliophthora roreri]